MKQTKQNFLILILLVFSVLGLKAQIANPNCSTTPTLTTGTYTNLIVNSGSIGWYNYIPTTSNAIITLINRNNNSNTKITKIEFYSGNCGALTLMAIDSLSNATDSTLYITTASLNTNQIYKIKLYRTTSQDVESSFIVNLFSATYCGISYGTDPLTPTPYAPLGDWNGFTNACFVDNSGGSNIPAQYAICDYTYVPTCNSQTLFLAFAFNATFPGDNSYANAVFYIFSQAQPLQ